MLEMILPTAFLGIFFTFIGWVIKSQNAADMLNGFNDKTDDKEKLSKIMGNNLLTIGISILVIGVIGLICGPSLYKYFCILQVIVMICLLVVGIYRANKYGKKDK